MPPSNKRFDCLSGFCCQLAQRQFLISSKSCNCASVQIRKKVKDCWVLFPKGYNCWAVRVQKTCSSVQFHTERTEKELGLQILARMYGRVIGTSPIRLSPTGHSPIANVHYTFANIFYRMSPTGESRLRGRPLTWQSLANNCVSTIFSPMHAKCFRQWQY